MKTTTYPRDGEGRLLTATHGVLSLDELNTYQSGDHEDQYPAIDRMTASICTQRQDQIEAGSILIADLTSCGLSRNESHMLGLVSAGWTMAEAAGIIGVPYNVAHNAMRSMQKKIRPLLEPS